MLKVTYFGTTTLLFDDGKDQILFDAHFTRPPLIKHICSLKAGTDTVLCDELIHRHRIERLRAIFISHTHYDHVMDAPYMARKCGAEIFGSRSCANVALGGGVRRDRIRRFRHGSSFVIGEYRIRILKSLHSRPNRLNDDLGVPIRKPLVQPARLRDYTEGGSYDFYIEHGEKKILIRPGFNYIEGQLDGIHADILFLGISGLGKAGPDLTQKFFEETVGKIRPGLVIPIHWDNIYVPLSKPVAGMPGLFEKTGIAFFKLAKYCEAHGINCVLQYPCTGMEF